MFKNQRQTLFYFPFLVLSYGLRGILPIVDFVSGAIEETLARVCPVCLTPPRASCTTVSTRSNPLSASRCIVSVPAEHLEHCWYGTPSYSLYFERGLTTAHPLQYLKFLFAQKAAESFLKQSLQLMYRPPSRLFSLNSIAALPF